MLGEKSENTADYFEKCSKKSFLSRGKAKKVMIIKYICP